ncbi:MAG TPA: TspO/MBR family protein [Balneolales bacterium]|nr:TspO/MBR family protein [Balneolales bacterium]
MLYSILGLIVSLLLAFAAAYAGAVVSPGIASSDWYNELRKPEWNPPTWLFGPVWTALYAMMAIAAWVVWKQHGFYEAQKALVIYLIQLVINAGWSWIFFGWHRLGWALVEIMLLWLFVFWTILAFSTYSLVAAWLMVPYLLWVSFAMILNASIWRRNRA